ncbi:MAG: MFS transporter [Pseudomonadales bacterium]|nr:MFS transporter [Pseudomonadales bacterium]
MSASRFSALGSALSNRNYAIYISCNSVSLIGFWMQRLAVSWLTWEISHSEFWVGAVAFAEIAPLIVVGPLFGVWADRFDRKGMAVVIQVLMMAQAFVLFYLAVTGRLTIALLFSLALIEGVVQAAYQPIRLALVPNLVPKKDLVAASAFTAVMFNVARFLGPAIAGVIMSLYGAAFAVLVNGITYGLIVIAWFFIRLPDMAPATGRQQSFFTDIKAGFRYVLDIPALFYMFVLLTFIGLFARPLTFMLSAFVGAVYERGPETLALFTSAMGIGAVLAGLKLSMDGQTRGLVRAILLSTLGSIIATIWFAGTDRLWLATGLIFFLGYAITIASVASQTLVQNSIDDRMRGRVLSLWVAGTRGAPAIGVLIIGWFASRFGLMWPNVVAALLCLMVLVLMNRRRRVMRGFFESDAQ